MLQSRSRRTRFKRGQLWAKLNESDVLRQNKNKPRSNYRRGGFKEAYVLAVVNKGQNERRKRTSTKQKQAEEKVPQRCFKNARRHSFCTMKNPTTKNNPDSFLEVTLS